MVKTSWNRLLDLTYGWYQFVEADESREEEPLTDDRLPSQELFDLYQPRERGILKKPKKELSLGTEAETRAFLNEKILPLLPRQ